MISYWYANVVCLCVHLSVMLCIVAKIHRAMVSEHMSRKCSWETWFFNFLPHYTDLEHK